MHDTITKMKDSKNKCKRHRDNWKRRSVALSGLCKELFRANHNLHLIEHHKNVDESFWRDCDKFFDEKMKEYEKIMEGIKDENEREEQNESGD